MPYDDVEGGTLGRGGFAEVRLCTDDRGSPFAKKVLTAHDEESVRRFRHEVEILLQIPGPHIMPVIAADLNSNPPYYVMPIYGYTLRAIIPELARQHARIPGIFRHILSAVQHAHERGVIHRDLNPNNILMNSDEEVVASDFGLGRRLDASVRLTGSHAAMGTSGYMAPEQYRDAGRADARSDIFALGVILNEMYSGTTNLGVYVSAPVLVIVRKCTNPSPDLRYQNVAALRVSFDGLLNIQVRQDAGEELRRFIAAQMPVTSAEAIAALVPGLDGDARVLHDAVVVMPADTFARISQAKSEVAALLIDKFEEIALSESWSFEYTDQIGAACRRLFRATADANVKAALLRTALHVAVGYNRFYVMDVAAGLLQSPMTDTEAVTIMASLEPIRHNLVAISDRLTRSQVHPVLLALIDVANHENSQ